MLMMSDTDITTTHIQDFVYFLTYIQSNQLAITRYIIVIAKSTSLPN